MKAPSEVIGIEIMERKKKMHDSDEFQTHYCNLNALMHPSLT